MSVLSHSVVDGALVVKPARRIDSSNSKAFEEEAHALVNGNVSKVVIDASEVEYISSAGLRVILTTAKKAKSLGGGLTICSAKGMAKEVLAVSGFDSIFGIHADVSAAIAALK